MPNKQPPEPVRKDYRFGRLVPLPSAADQFHYRILQARQFKHRTFEIVVGLILVFLAEHKVLIGIADYFGQVDDFVCRRAFRQLDFRRIAVVCQQAGDGGIVAFRNLAFSALGIA